MAKGLQIQGREKFFDLGVSAEFAIAFKRVAMAYRNDPIVITATFRTINFAHPNCRCVMEPTIG